MTEFNPKNVRTEVAWVYGATLAITGGLALAQTSVGWLREFILAIVAALFLYLPLEVLYRKKIDPAAFGIHRKDIWRALKNALLVSLIVFPLYGVCFHVYQTDWLGRTAQPAEAQWKQWPIEVQDAPKVIALEEGEVRLHMTGDIARVEWSLPPGQVFELRAQSQGGLTPYLTNPRNRSETELYYLQSHRGKIGFEVPGQEVQLLVKAGDDSLPPERLKLGTALQSADEMPITLTRSFFWLFNIILVQFLLVALPEEVFYRGYLQTRLDQLFPKETQVLGVSVSVMSIVLTSTLFAIGHYVTIPAPSRLAVFFPSLLFGWMRRATGGIMAPLIFHALCNLFVEFAQLHYG